MCSNPRSWPFGSHNSPKKWHPLGSHVRVIHEVRGMEAITVEQVLREAILAAFQK
jgi:hypothetical protein